MKNLTATAGCPDLSVTFSIDDRAELRISPALLSQYDVRQTDCRAGAWQSLQHLDSILGIADTRRDEDGLLILTEPAPPGFISLFDAARQGLAREAVRRAALELAHTFCALQSTGFVYGFALPEMIRTRPADGQVALLFQPLPTAIPIVEHMDSRLPGVLFGTYTRQYRLSPASDHYLMGLLLHLLITGRLPADRLPTAEPAAEPEPDLGSGDGVLPAPGGELERLTRLYTQLLRHPEQFRNMEEVRSELLRIWAPEEAPAEPAAYAAPQLHPVTAYANRAEDLALRHFLTSEHTGVLALTGQDEAVRFAALRWKMNECSEYNLFFTVHCTGHPLGVIKEIIDRTLANSIGWAPEAAAGLGTWRTSFDYLLKQYYRGRDSHLEIVEWLYGLVTAVAPLFPQRLCYIFEDSHRMDELSAIILCEFYMRYGVETPGLRILFSGQSLPERWKDSGIPVLDTDIRSVEDYRRLLLLTLGRAEESLAEQLARVFHSRGVSPLDCRPILKALVSEGIIRNTPAGWAPVPETGWEERIPSSERVYRNSLNKLSSAHRSLLRTLSCLPAPVRPVRTWSKNGMDTGELHRALEEFWLTDTASVFHANSLYIPKHVREWLMAGLSPEEIRFHHVTALEWHRRVRPADYTQLYELSRAAHDPYRQLYYLILYYRKNRSHLSLEHTAQIVTGILKLQPEVMKPENKGWSRLLGHVYLSLARDSAARDVMENLYERHRCETDRLFLLQLKLSMNELPVAEVREELYPLLYSEEPILHRAQAAQFIMQCMTVSPPPQERVVEMDRYFSQVLYPGRKHLPLRIYSELCAVYAGMSFRMLPDRKEWTLSLLHKLLGTIEASRSPYLSLRIYNALTFQTNIRKMAEYNRLFIESANRTGVTKAALIGHLNALVVSVFMGDVHSYRYHLARIDPEQFDYPSLRDSYMAFRLLYAVEWNDRLSFTELNAYFVRLEALTPLTKLRVELCRSYAAFRFGEQPSPVQTAGADGPERDSFKRALDQLGEGRTADGIRELEQIIDGIVPAPHGFDIIIGWAYRELLSMKLGSTSPDHGIAGWLDRFETFISTQGFELFLPDHSRLKAEYLMRLGCRDEAYLHFRSAMHGFMAIGKEQEALRVTERMEEAARPSHWEEDNKICPTPLLMALLQDRAAMMEQLTDQQVHRMFVESLNQSLDLHQTIDRIAHFLFHYFPVGDCRVRFRSRHTDVTEIRVPHGIVDAARAQEMILFSTDRISLEIFNQNGQSVSMDLGMRSGAPARHQALRYFLQMTKPYVQNCLLYMEMNTDSLTGLYVRRHFMSLLSREFVISQRYQLGLSVIMLDLDNFRLVNEFGHQEGDRVLEEVASLLRTCTGNEDILGRYGGEEFIVILPKADGKEALKKAQRIGALIGDTFSYGRPYRVTASIGVASVDHLEAATMEELIRHADEAEIHAKKTGKNKVVSAWSIPHE